MFCARSSSRCFSSRARKAFSSNSFTFAASSAALASACFFSVAAFRLRAYHFLPRRSSSTSCAVRLQKDEVKHLVRGKVNIRRRGGGGDGKRVKVRVSTRDINLLCSVFQGPSPLLACHLSVSRGRVSCRSFLS